jgi:hypothetical protein
VAAWVGVGVTLALAAGAVAEGLSSNHLYDNLSSTCGQTRGGCPSDQIDTVRSRDRVTTILWVATGVVGVGTGALFLVGGHEPGVAVAGRF